MEQATRRARTAAGGRIAAVLAGTIVIWSLMACVSLEVFGGVAITITLILTRAKPNWRVPEPDEDP